MASKKVELDHKDMVHDSAIDYYGKRLATASSDSTVKIVSIGAATAPSQVLATLTGHYGPVWRVAWAHPKYGTVLASCGYDGRVIVWKRMLEAIGLKSMCLLTTSRLSTPLLGLRTRLACALPVRLVMEEYLS